MRWHIIHGLYTFADNTREIRVSSIYIRTHIYVCLCVYIQTKLFLLNVMHLWYFTCRRKISIFSLIIKMKIFKEIHKIFYFASAVTVINTFSLFKVKNEFFEWVSYPLLALIAHMCFQYYITVQLYCCFLRNFQI